MGSQGSRWGFFLPMCDHQVFMCSVFKLSIIEFEAILPALLLYLLGVPHLFVHFRILRHTVRAPNVSHICWMPTSFSATTFFHVKLSISTHSLSEHCPRTIWRLPEIVSLRCRHWLLLINLLLMVASNSRCCSFSISKSDD